MKKELFLENAKQAAAAAQKVCRIVPLIGGSRDDFATLMLLREKWASITDSYQHKSDYEKKKVSKEEHNLWSLKAIKVMAELATENGVGMCGELASIAFEWLKNNGVYPIDYVKVKGTAERTGHAFVVLGRDPSSDINDHRTWGENATICDPWYGALDDSEKSGCFYSSALCYLQEKYPLIMGERETTSLSVTADFKIGLNSNVLR